MTKRKTKAATSKAKLPSPLTLADEALRAHAFVHGQLELGLKCIDLLKEHVMQSYPDQKLDAEGAMKILAAAQVFLGDARDRSQRLGGSVMELRQFQNA